MGASKRCRKAIPGGIPGRGTKCPRRAYGALSTAHSFPKPTCCNFALILHHCCADARLPLRGSAGYGIKRANAPRAGKKGRFALPYGQDSIYIAQRRSSHFCRNTSQGIGFGLQDLLPTMKALPALERHAPLIIQRLAPKHSSLWPGASTPSTKPPKREHAYKAWFFSTVGGVNHAP